MKMNYLLFYCNSETINRMRFLVLCDLLLFSIGVHNKMFKIIFKLILCCLYHFLFHVHALLMVH